MEIVSFKKTKTNIYDVEMDNGETLKLYDDIILKYELLINKKITPSKLKEVLKENELMDAYYKALKYIGIKMRTEKEIRLYLEKKEISNDAITYAINNLTRLGYINGDKYTIAYINDAVNLSLDGPNKITNSLKKLGISSTVIEKHLSTLSNDVWENKIQKIIDKKAKTNKYSEVMFKNKVHTYLISLGYDHEMIKSMLEEYHIDTSAQFMNEANKVWNLLSKKYDKTEMLFRFKNKMFLKGYSSSDINLFIEKKENDNL